MLASAVLVVALGMVGYGLTFAMFTSLRFEERLAIGMVTGPLAAAVVSLLAFLPAG